MESNTRAPASWIEEQALVGVRFARGGRVVCHLELGLRGRVCAESLRAAVVERLFQLRVQLVRWERAVEDRLDLHRLTLVEFDGGSLEPSRRGSIAAELRSLVHDLASAPQESRPALLKATKAATVAPLRVGVVAA